jgi:hypothetical protein
MGRTRRTDLDLPPCVYRRRGRFYLVATRRGVSTWISLGADRDQAIAAALPLLRAIRRGADPKATRAAIMQRDGYRCTYCGATRDLELDHFIPQARGGSHSARNLVVACRRCNAAKGDRDPLEFLRNLQPGALSL